MRAAVLAIVAFGACAHVQSAPPSSPREFAAADRAAITTVLTDQQAAWNRGDLVAFMAGYAHTDQIVFTSGGEIRRGWQAALDHYQARYGHDRASMGTLELAIDEIDPVGADAAIALGHWHLVGPTAGHGVFSLVFARTPDGWRIVHDHTSAAASP